MYIKPHSLDLNEHEEDSNVSYVIRFRKGYSNDKMVLALDPKVKETSGQIVHATQATYISVGHTSTSIPDENHAGKRDIDRQIDLAHQVYGQRLIQEAGCASKLLRRGRQRLTTESGTDMTNHAEEVEQWMMDTLDIHRKPSI